MFASSLQLVVAFCTIGQLDQREKIHRIIVAHDQMQKSIATGVVEMELQDDRPDKIMPAATISKQIREKQSTPKTISPHYRLQWKFDSNSDYIKIVDVRIPQYSPDGPLGYINEIYNGVNGFTSLIGDNKNKVPDIEIGRVAVYKTGKSNDPLCLEYPLKNYLNMQFVSKKSRVPLVEYIAKADSCSLIAEPGNSSEKCYELNVISDGFEVVLYIDPSLNYYVRKIRTVKSATGLMLEADATQFSEVSAGIFFPRRIEWKLRFPSVTYNIIMSLTNITIYSISLIEVAPPKIPYNAVVTESTSSKVYVWGDDAPRETFINNNEFLKWKTALVGSKISERAVTLSVTSYILIGCTILLLIILVVVLVRYRRKGITGD